MTVAQRRFSQITGSTANFTTNDFLLGVQTGADDVLFRRTQVFAEAFTTAGITVDGIGPILVTVQGSASSIVNYYDNPLILLLNTTQTNGNMFAIDWRTTGGHSVAAIAGVYSDHAGVGKGELRFFTSDGEGAGVLHGKFSTKGTLELTPKRDELNSGFTVQQNGIGSTGIFTPVFYNSIQIDSDQADIASVGQPACGLYINQNFGGGNTQGARSAIWAQVNNAGGPSKSGSNDRDFVGGTFGAIASVSESTGGSLAGFFANEQFVGIGPGLTNIAGAIGSEMDITVQSNGLATRVGQNIVDNGSTFQASVTDAAVIISATGGTSIGWKNGVLFSDYNGQQPFNANASIIATAGASTVTNGIDFSSYTITNYFLRGPNDLFTVAGSGLLTLQSASHSMAEEGHTPSRLLIMDGSTSVPVTAGDTPTLTLSRVESIVDGTSGGDGSGGAALSVNTETNNTQQLNAMKVVAIAKPGPSGSTNDTVAGYFVGINRALHASGRTAYGVYAVAQATQVGMGAQCLATGLFNSTGSDLPYFNGFTGPFFGVLDAVAQGGNLSTAGVLFRSDNIGTSGFSVGLVAVPNSIVTSFVRDDSGSVNVVEATNAHTNGVNLSTATFSGNAYSSPGFSVDGTGVVAGGELRAGGDTGGAASKNTLTNTSDLTGNSTGVGTILFKGTTNRNSSGFIKFYIGTTAYYVPVFSAITG